jgi:hypothetical protein
VSHLTDSDRLKIEHGLYRRIEPGNLLNRGPEEYYTSEPFPLKGNAILDEIKWEGEVPPKTWVAAKVRTAPNPE